MSELCFSGLLVLLVGAGAILLVGLVVVVMDERKVVESGDGKFTLTTHRVKRRAESWGASEFTSIPLEAVTSCGVEYKSIIGLGVASLVCFLAALGAGLVPAYREPVAGAAAVVGVIFGLFYLSSRRRVVSISSPSSSIELNVEVSFDEAVGMVNRIEEVRGERVREIRGSSSR